MDFTYIGVDDENYESWALTPRIVGDDKFIVHMPSGFQLELPNFFNLFTEHQNRQRPEEKKLWRSHFANNGGGSLLVRRNLVHYESGLTPIIWIDLVENRRRYRYLDFSSGKIRVWETRIPYNGCEYLRVLYYQNVRYLQLMEKKWMSDRIDTANKEAKEVRAVFHHIRQKNKDLEGFITTAAEVFEESNKRKREDEKDCGNNREKRHKADPDYFERGISLDLLNPDPQELLKLNLKNVLMNLINKSSDEVLCDCVRPIFWRLPVPTVVSLLDFK